MKIENISLKSIDIIYDLFEVKVNDDKIKELKFIARKTGGTRVLSEVKIIYATGTERSYSVLKAHKKYKELFEKQIKNYKTWR